MQVSKQQTAAEAFETVLAEEELRLNGFDAWRALLTAHATLIRRLETDLELATGLALADFDVLAQLAIGGGQLRMSELADKALISRSGMTRRVARLMDQGLVARDTTQADARGVVVSLTPAGLSRLMSTTRVHARGVNELFVSRLDEDELAALLAMLTKVKADCSFG